MARHSVPAIAASAVVLAVTAGFYVYAMSLRSTREAGQYPLQAVFLSANGLSVGADVRIAGVKVGTVSAIALDTTQFVTRVTFNVLDAYQLPKDTSLGIGSSGFTASTALTVAPGHAAERLKPGDTIRSTREMVSLEQSVSNYIFGAGGLNNAGTP